MHPHVPAERDESGERNCIASNGIDEDRRHARRQDATVPIQIDHRRRASAITDRTRRRCVLDVTTERTLAFDPHARSVHYRATRIERATHTFIRFEISAIETVRDWKRAHRRRALDARVVAKVTVRQVDLSQTQRRLDAARSKSVRFQSSRTFERIFGETALIRLQRARTDSVEHVVRTTQAATRT